MVAELSETWDWSSPDDQTTWVSEGSLYLQVGGGLSYGVKPNGGKFVPSLGTRPRGNPTYGLSGVRGSLVSTDHHGNIMSIFKRHGSEASMDRRAGPVSLTRRQVTTSVHVLFVVRRILYA